MKKQLSVLLLLLIVAAFLFAAAVPGAADMGGFSGDSDYGGGDWGGSDYDSDWDSDYGGSGSTIYLSDDSATVILIIIAAFIIYSVIRSKLHPSTPKVSGGGATPVDQSKLTDMSKYKELDPNFSEADFKEKIANMYVRFQNRWTEKNMEPMRGEMTDALYNQIDRQLQPLKDNHQTNRVDNIAVLDVALRGYMQNDEQDTVVVTVKTRIIDYYVDDNTGKVVKGSNSIERFMTYEWEMIRKKGMKTGDAEHEVTVNCPNCGAPVNINHSARCEYCGSILTNADYDWVLSSIKGISQQSSR